MSQILNESIQAKNHAKREEISLRIENLRKESKGPRQSLAAKIAFSSQIKVLEGEYDVLRRAVFDSIPQVGTSTSLRTL